MSSRPPPITERTARSSAVGRLYNSNLRPMIIVLALFSGIWTLVWAVDLFRDINFDKDHGQPKLATFAIVLGSLYITNTAIEAFGITAASLQNLQLVRIYSFANAFSSLLIVVAGFIRTITHFVLKSNLIKECTDVSTGSDLVFRFGIWGPTVRDHLDADEAEQFCKNAWNHDSVNEIISLLFEIVLAGFFALLTFTYYRQLLNPTAGRTQERIPPSQQWAQSQPYPGQGPSYQPYYQPPYMNYNNAESVNTFVPPYDANGKPPAYVGDGVPGDGKDKDIKDDPFADFEGQSKNNHARGPAESRDSFV